MPVKNSTRIHPNEYASQGYDQPRPANEENEQLTLLVNKWSDYIPRIISGAR